MSNLISRDFGSFLDGFSRQLWGDIPWTTELRAVPFRSHFDKEGHYIEADLPGFEPGDVTVSLQGDVLQIVSSFADDETRLGRKLAFKREFQLPEDSNLNAIEAVLKNGVLRISIGKKPELQPRAIPVTS